jgi:hypothetical protein
MRAPFDAQPAKQRESQQNGEQHFAEGEGEREQQAVQERDMAASHRVR